MIDGLFSLSEINRIIENVNYCELKSIKIYGIGEGISPFGIEKIFPHIIYSLNPHKLIQGLFSSLPTKKDKGILEIVDSELNIMILTQKR